MWKRAETCVTFTVCGTVDGESLRNRLGQRKESCLKMISWPALLPAVGVAMFLLSLSRRASAVTVNTPPHSGLQLNDAADRLSAYLGSALDAPAAAPCGRKPQPHPQEKVTGTAPKR
jgi:hypothetical protein